MKTYAIGDVHGCFDTLEKLLQQIPNESRLIFIGDIINRGPKSLETIRTVMRMGDRAECLLGNHELHLLAVYAGQRAMSPEDTISEILNAPDCDDIIQWLRNRPLALVDHGFLCVHAATHWSWSVEETLKQASRVEKFIRSDKGLSQTRGAFRQAAVEFGSSRQRPIARRRQRADAYSLSQCRRYDGFQTETFSCRYAC